MRFHPSMHLTQTEGRAIGDVRKPNPMEVLKEINITSFLDRWGPAHVVQVYDTALNMQGILVIDNTVLGPGCGGVKIAPNITPREVYERARSRTWSCALLDLRFGGAAAGIRANPSDVDRVQLVQAFARKVSFFVPSLFVAAPDLNVEQAEMAAFAEEVGDHRGVTGKPESMHGIPYELGVVGFGMAIAIEATLEAVGAKGGMPEGLGNARVALHGFESVGTPLAKYIAHKGARIVALCDEGCTVHDPKGIDIESVPMRQTKSGPRAAIREIEGVEVLPSEKLSGLECDILVCANGRCVLHEDNVKKVKARCVVEGLNDPITPMARQQLFKDGVLVLPNILATAGGVISSYAEYNRNSSERAFSMIVSKMRDVTIEVVTGALAQRIPPVRVAKERAKERILESMENDQLREGVE